MRLVLDTNVVVSGLIWDGPPRRLIDLVASGDVALFSSTVLLEEFAGVLERRKFAASSAARDLTATFLAQRYAAVTTFVFPASADRLVPIKICLFTRRLPSTGKYSPRSLPRPRLCGNRSVVHAASTDRLIIDHNTS